MVETGYALLLVLAFGIVAWFAVFVVYRLYLGQR